MSNYQHDLSAESVRNNKTSVLNSSHFISIIAASMVMLTAGSIYVFSLWGPKFASELELTQSQISFVAAAGNNGLYVSAPIVGYLVDHYTRYSHAFLIVGGSLIYSGYGLLILAYYKTIDVGYITLAIFNACVGIGGACCYGYSLATNVRNWPATHRGIAVGIPVAVFGLAAFVYSQIIRVFFLKENGLDVRSSLQMMGGMALLLNIIISFILTDQRTESSLNSRELVDLQEESEELLVNASDLAVPEPILLERSPSQSVKYRNPQTVQDSTRRRISVPAVEHQINQQISIFRSIDAYLLGTVLLLCAGIGLMYINNCGAIIKSLVPDSLESVKYQSFHVGEVSISSFLGRLFAGALLDVLSKRIGLNLLFWPFLSAFFLLLGSLYGGWIIESITQLYIQTFLIGFGYGILWTAIPVLVGHYFGIENFAFNWGWFQVLPAIGGQITSTVYGLIIDSCLEGLCFSKSFKFTAGLCTIAILCIGILYKRSQNSIQ